MKVLSPNSGLRNLREQLPEIWLWRPAGYDCWISPRLEDIETSLLEGAHRILTRTQGKQWLHSVGQTYLVVLSLLWRQGGYGFLLDSITRRSSEEYHCHELSWGYHFSSPRPVSTQQLVSFSAGMPLSKQPTEGEISCPTYQQTSWLMSSWAHYRCLLNTPHDMAPAYQRQDPVPLSSEQAPVSSYQEPCTSTSLSSMGGREQKQGELQPYSLRNRKP